MRSLLPLSAFLALAACGSGDLPGNDALAPANDMMPDAATDALNQTELTVVDEGPTEAGAALPPAGQGLRFVGRWAADASFCADKAWIFAADRLATPAGSACSFSDVKAVPGGYDIAASCTAEGPEQEDRLEIRFAESARAMMFESKSIAGAGLVWCGDGE